jgi:ABC-2 type transport system permease protein
MSNNAINLIARNEFANIIRHPLVIITIVALCAIIIVNGAGSHWLLFVLKNMGIKEVFMLGVSNAFTNTSVVLSFLALCLGIISVAGERSNGSLRVLLTKPLYRRDVIVGKYLGINAVILTLATFTLMISVASIMVSYGGPESPQMILSMAFYIFLLYIFCSLMSGLMLLVSILFRDISMALILSMSFLYLVWFVDIPMSLQNVWMVSPVLQYFTVANGLLTPQSSFIQWFENALPWIVLMIFETIIIFLMNCFLFNREES